MLEICAIASGSNGNCYYIGNETDAVLIDAGISYKMIKTRMLEKGLSILIKLKPYLFRTNIPTTFAEQELLGKE